MDHPLWQPSAQQVEDSNLTRFRRAVNERWGAGLGDYAALHRWSIERPDRFWRSLWEFAEVIAETTGETTLIDGHKMPGARFFPEAKLNLAENLLRRRDGADAIVFCGEDKVRRRLSHAQLYDAVARLMASRPSVACLQTGFPCGGTTSRSRP